MANAFADPTFSNRISRHSDVLVALAVVAILGVMIIPLPPALLDLLLAFNITFALLIMLVTMYNTEPLSFSVFPGLLLIVTLFRLSLNVASTRLILGDAYAGKIISAFGGFVVKGNYVVGLVIFLILVVIQFVVITKGAGRIAEVAARFTLDAMPGKQMSIDADLNAGLIDDREARERREKIAREADFYGAMDGASKFVRGDAIAGLVITAINILGGFVIGVLQLKMPLKQALETYTVLTVGDGLVTQIPALIISTSAGIIVTRAAAESNLGFDLTRQILAKPRAIAIAAGILVVLGIVPGLPTLPFFVLAAVTGVIAYTTGQAQKGIAEEEIEEKAEGAKERVEQYLQVDPLELEIGYGLIPLVDAERGGDLLSRITMIRKQCALELGIIVPPIRIRDNIQLKSNAYMIKIKGVEVAEGSLMVGYYLALDPGIAEETIEGIPTTEPTFGLPAYWVSEIQKERAELAGYTVVEAPAVLATHLMEVIKGYAHELLGRQEVQKLIDNVREDHPAVVEELIPNLLTVGAVQKVLQNLLREGVPIRDLVTVLETLADYAPYTKDLGLLTEYVRGSLGRVISKPFQEQEGPIPAITLDPKLEQLISEAAQQPTPQQGRDLSIPPEVLQKIYDDLGKEVEGMVADGHRPVVVCSPTVRRHFRHMVEPVFPTLAVLSYTELPLNAEVKPRAMVRLSDES